MRVEAARQKRMESALMSAFSAVAAHEDAMIKLGEAVVELREIGESNASIADRLGVERRVVSEAWALCRPEEEPDSDDTVADEEDGATVDDGTARREHD